MKMSPMEDAFSFLKFEISLSKKSVQIFSSLSLKMKMIIGDAKEIGSILIFVLNDTVHDAASLCKLFTKRHGDKILMGSESKMRHLLSHF